MSLLVTASLSGASGVTTTALGMASTWPDDESVTVIEADPMGGTIAARWLRPARPGLTDLAAAAATVLGSPGPEALVEASQPVEVAGTVLPVVCAAPGGPAVADEVALIATAAAKILRSVPGPVIADAGALYPGTPAWPLLAEADYTILVVPARLDAIARLQAWWQLLTAQTRGRCGIAIGPGTLRQAEMTGLLYAAGARAGQHTDIAGPLGSAKVLAPDAFTSPTRRALAPWRALAAHAAEAANAPAPRAIEAARPGHNLEEGT